MTRRLPLLLLSLPVAIAVSAPATPAYAEPQVYRLTPAEREAAIAAASHRTDTDTPALLPDPGRDRVLESSLYAGDERPDRRVHGEVGMTIGTGGTRGIYGTTVAPLGETGTAAFAFSIGQGRGFYGPYGGYGPGYGVYPGYFSPGYPLSLLPVPAGRPAPVR